GPGRQLKHMNSINRSMKPKNRLNLAAAALVMAGTSMGWATDSISLGSFDTSDITGWKGLDHTTIQWVGTQDAGGTGSKGALEIHLVNSTPSDWQSAQAQFDLGSKTFNSASYWSVSFDIRVDPSSSPGTSTAFGYVDVVPLGNGWTWLDKLCWIPATQEFTNWQHIEATFQAPYANLDALVFQMNDNHFAGDVIYYIDNIKVNPVPFNAFVDQFTDSAEAGGWAWQNWSQPGAVTWTSTPDAGGATPTGSLKLDCNFNNPTPPAWQQVVFQKDVHVNPNLFANLEMDVMVDPASSPMGNGAFPDFEAILNVNGDFYWLHLGAQALPKPANGWRHLSFPLSGALASAPAPVTNLNSIILWLGGGSDGSFGPTNTIRYYVDNIQFAQIRPNLVLEDNHRPAGLEIGCTPSGSIWQRQGIVTPASTRNYTWVGRNQPVTYSFTITNFPDFSGFPGFEAHLYLMNYDTLVNPSWDEVWSEVDYNAADLVYLKLKNSGDGVEFSFNYKTDAPNSTSYTWVDSLYETNALGKWQVTFNTDDTVTLTGPYGDTETFYFDPSLAGHFAGQMSLNLGVAKNGTTANDNASATFSAIEVTGVPNPINETFPGVALNPDPGNPFWRLAVSDASGLRFVPAATARWLTWSLPDAGFTLETSASVVGPWAPLAPPSTYQTATSKSVPLSATALASGSAFFRLAHSGQ
ncbi:MAG TPA: hypothetical protein VHI52_18680, partial [Verrucomicrobiae bacterium]|nr:hypothetical protein [Verrucomicrobiae bacterium]